MAVVPLTDSNDTLDLRNAPIDPTRRVVARGGNDTVYGTNEYDVIYADYASISNAWRQPVTGIEDYAVINDFARGGDKIRIGGSFNDYTLETRYNYAGGSAADTAIFYRGDLIAVVANTTTAVTLDTTCFIL